MIRPLVAGGALLLLLAGCASMQNTVAQDLAWERWRKCNHFRTISLKEIKTDGSIWVWAGETPELSAWRACDSAVRAEQAKGTKTSIQRGIHAPPRSSGCSRIRQSRYARLSHTLLMSFASVMRSLPLHPVWVHSVGEAS